MRRFIFLTAAIGLAVASAGLAPAGAAPSGPQGAVVSGSGHVCSAAPSPNVGPEPTCTYTIPVPSGYQGQAPFTITYTVGTVTTTITCPPQCSDGSTPPAPGPIPANTAITVSVPAGSGGFVAAGSAASTG